MTLVWKARAIPASKLSLGQDNKESVHLVGVIAPAIVYRSVLRSRCVCEGKGGSSRLSCTTVVFVCRCPLHAIPADPTD
jgi:hypothetical protein